MCKKQKMFTAKRIQDRSLISSIMPKLEDQFFVHSHMLNELWMLNCSSSSDNQNKNNFMFGICTKHVNQQRIECQIMV